MDPNFVNQVKEWLRAHASKIPSNIYGVERQIYIRHATIQMMQDEERMLLRNYINGCLRTMRELDASDIDLGGWGGNKMVWLRVHGIKKPFPELGAFDIPEFDILILNLLLASQRDLLNKDKSLDFSYSVEDGGGGMFRYRASAYYEMDALALNMRAINTAIKPYEGYGFHPAVTQILSLVHTKEGLILVTGITGSGKSTTLDAIVDLNNRSINSHIVIIASPVEFVHQSKRCIVRHREVGRDTSSFKHGTIEAMRQDPDCIVIGEMRDPETIMAALEAADSGHKVLSTLHTSSSIESIERIIGEIPTNEQERVRNRLADILKCVVSQKLVPNVTGKRVMAKEIMVMIPSIRSAIKNDNIGEIYQMIAEGSKYGMLTMEQDLKQLVIQNQITPENAMNFANNKRMMQHLMQSS